MKDVPDLQYWTDDTPGITRRRAGRGWSYRAPDGTRIDRGAERRRLDGLGVPPAYEEVWMCPAANGHLQATGRDARRRKQYRYHPDWTAFRARKKFEGLAAFGEALPRIRDRIRRDLTAADGDRDLAVAAILAMIDRLSLRVGSDVYARRNGAYGATTLRGTHVRMDGDGLRLSYTAKGGKRLTRRVGAGPLARVLERMDDLPGARLVSWTDETGAPHAVTADMVNERIAEITGGAHTAKTFRTWAGTVAALEAAAATEEATIKAMSEAASKRLGNTPAIARTSYIHPRVIAMTDWPAEDRCALIAEACDIRGLRKAERALLTLLRR